MYEIFGVERLEDRLLMAVNITQIDGVLVIEGDAADDRILVQGTGEGEVAVYVDDEGDGFGADDLYGEYSGVKHVRVSLGDGHNEILVEGLDIDGHLTVDGGDGEDVVDVVDCGIGGNVSINTGDAPRFPHDRVRVAGADIDGKLTIDTGDGYGDVLLRGFSHIGGDVSVETGDGRDIVLVRNADIDGKLTINTGDGGDLVDLYGGLDVDGKTLIDTGEGEIEGEIEIDLVFVQAKLADTELADLVVSTGGGVDLVRFGGGSRAVTIEGRTDINLGSGDDLLGLAGLTFVGDFSADLGSGDDVLRLAVPPFLGLTFFGDFSADGGAGDDKFEEPYGDAFFGGKFTVKDFESVTGL